jgi:hypothetical protein
MVLSANGGSNQAAKFGTIQTYIAGAPIFRYALVVVRLGDSKVYPAVEDITDAYKQVVIGFATEQVTAANLAIRVRREGHYLLTLAGSPAQAIGRLACIKDDNTVQLWADDGHSYQVVGRITEKPDAVSVYVDLLDRPQRLATSAYE